MTITVTYDGTEECAEAIDAISIGGYRHVIAEFDVKLWHEWKHGGHTGEALVVLNNLLNTWHELKADLPRGGE